MEYGVLTSNKFAFLGDDDDVHDPAEVLARAEQAKEKEKLSGGPKTALAAAVKKTTAAVEKKSVSIAPAHTHNKENVDVQGRRGGGGNQGPRRDYRGAKDGQGPRGPPRGPRRNHQEGENNAVAPAVDANEMSDRFGESRPPRAPRGQNNYRGNNEHRGGGGRGGNNNNNGGGWQRSGDRGDHHPGNNNPRPPRYPRNENNEHTNNGMPQDPDGQPLVRTRFQRGGRNGPRAERLSGSDKTGVRSVPKKDGFGKGNWGTEKDELTGETEPTHENKPANDAPVDTWHANTDDTTTLHEKADASQEGDQAAGEPEQDKVRELTLEEWKAQQKSQKPSFNVRKPGEGGEDQKIYQKLVLVKPQNEEQQQTEEEEEEANLNKREPREKPLNIEVSFSDSQRNRGGYREQREERGGNYARGEGGRGGYNRGGDSTRGDFERGDHRRSGGQGGGRTGGPGGPRGGANRGHYEPAGGSRRGQQQSGGGAFDLNSEAFPALGAR